MSGQPGLDHLKVGDPVLLGRKLYRAGNEYYEATITAQNRVWWTVEFYNSIRDIVETVKVHSVKLTTDSHVYDFLTTQERVDWGERQSAAWKYLLDEGIETHRSKRWNNDRLTLANLIRRHEGLDEF